MRSIGCRAALAAVLAAMTAGVALGADVRELAPMNEARADPAMAVTGGRLWVFGGYQYTSPTVTLDSIEVYDPATDSWLMSNSVMPAPRRNASAAACTSGPYAGRIFVFGGQQEGGAKYRNTWMFGPGDAHDPADDTWTTGLADIPGWYKDDGRVSAVALWVECDSAMWLVGGYGGTSPQETRVDKYDPVTDTWSSGPALNYPIQMDAVYEYGGLLYALQTVDRGGVEVCDPSAASPSWTEISTAPFQWPPWGLVGDEVFGFVGHPSQVVVYDIPSNTWRSEGLLPGGYWISGTLARTIGDTVYIPGGTGGTLAMNRLLAFTPREPTFHSDLIAFESDRSGNLDIWTMWDDGTELTQITSHPERDSEPDWSPDGTKIAFSSWRAGNGDGDIWVVDVQTGQLWQITSGSADEITATWSPDGTRIAYWHGYTAVFIVDVSDLNNPGTPVLLTTRHAMGPDWCANGYVAYQSGGGVYSIWATNPDTGDEYEVVDYVGGAGAYAPAWSPDGLELAYANLQSGGPSSHNDDIYVTAKAGPLPNLGTQITSDSVVGSTGVADSGPAWSPSGEQIYFYRWDYSGSPRHDIYVVNRDGTGLRNVTNRPDGYDSSPSVTRPPVYSPCLDDLIAFESDRSGNLDIWTMRADASDLTQITSHPERDSEPDWSPDSRFIAFSSDRAGNADIWVLHPTSGIHWRITQHDASDTSPTWSSDGTRIAFVSDRGTTGEVWVVDVSNLSHPGVPVKLTTYDPGIVDLEGELSPDWCANGYIAYQTERGHSHVWSIWATNPDDPSDEYEAVPYLGGAGAYCPAWSPDGVNLAYSNLQSGSPSSHNDDLYVLLDAKTPTASVHVAITDDSVIGNVGVGDYDPAWSTWDGRLYFARVDYATGAADVFVVDEEDGDPWNLTNRPDGIDRSPSVTAVPTCLQVLIDIKPGSDVNPINLGSDGSVPVAILSSATFDATGIDPDTLALAGASVDDGGEGTHTEDIDGDGLLDLVVQFLTQELDEAELSRGYAVLTGSIDGGDCFESLDIVTVIYLTDVPAGYWAEDSIAACIDADIVRGYLDDCYHPEYAVTRDQMAVFIARVIAGDEGLVPGGPAEPTFADVLADFWAYDHIEYVAANAIVEGYPSSSYHPEYDVSRDQLAVFLARAIASPLGDAGLAAYEPPETPTFSDVPADFWAFTHIEYLAEEGIVSGYEGRLYSPQTAVTRDQMAVYISQAFGLTE